VVYDSRLGGKDKQQMTQMSEQNENVTPSKIEMSPPLGNTSKIWNTEE